MLYSQNKFGNYYQLLSKIKTNLKKQNKFQKNKKIYIYYFCFFFLNGKYIHILNKEVS